MGTNEKASEGDFPTRSDSTRVLHVRNDEGFSEGVRPVTPPLHRASTWEAENAKLLQQMGRGQVERAFYARYDHPNAREVEAALAILEGTPAALCFASGISAITTTWDALLRPGDVLVLVGPLYGGTEAAARRASRQGVELRRAALEAPEAWPALFEGARLVHAESITNPTLRVPPLDVIAKTARAAGALTMVDATFASPVFQRPFELGCDLVMHSATKYLGGHSDLIAGCLGGPAPLLAEVALERRLLGTILAPDPAWQLLRSLRTLELRMLRIEATRFSLCESLRETPGMRDLRDPLHESHPDRDIVQRILRRGAGGMIAFDLASQDQAMRFLDALRIFRRAASLGGTESLACLPAHTSHAGLSEEQLAAAGITDSCIRLSIGLEDPTDLWDDLEGAFCAARL